MNGGFKFQALCMELKSCPVNYRIRPMGLEREGTKPLKESLMRKNELLYYLADAKFGSAKYQGFMDCMYQDELNDTREDLLNSMGGESDPIAKERTESSLRMNEQRMSLLEHSIEQKTMTLPGYFEAYYTVWGTFNELGSVLHNEAREIYPNDEKDVDIYVTREWRTIWDDVREELQSRDQTPNPLVSHQ